MKVVKKVDPLEIQRVEHLVVLLVNKKVVMKVELKVER